MGSWLALIILPLAGGNERARQLFTRYSPIYYPLLIFDWIRNVEEMWSQLSPFSIVTFASLSLFLEIIFLLKARRFYAGKDATRAFLCNKDHVAKKMKPIYATEDQIIKFKKVNIIFVCLLTLFLMLFAYKVFHNFFHGNDVSGSRLAVERIFTLIFVFGLIWLAMQVRKIYNFDAKGYEQLFSINLICFFSLLFSKSDTKLYWISITVSALVILFSGFIHHKLFKDRSLFKYYNG